MNYLSLCSGIEAATVAWEPLGWRALAYSEIEAFPSAVLSYHYPKTPNFGDMTLYNEWPDSLRPDLVVAGTPCQAFSVAGLRKGLEDPRGNLSLVFIGILDRLRPRWVVWENVPGVLSDKTGAFGALLGGLGELGYGFAYRVLDAQYYGVAQRRRRVFVVGCLGDWRAAAAVLFERDCLRGDPPPRREAGKGAAPGAAGCLGGSGQSGMNPPDLGGTGAFVPESCGTLRVRGGGGCGPEGPDAAVAGQLIPEVAGCLQDRDCKGADSDCKPGHLIPEIAHSLRGEGHSGSHANAGGQVDFCIPLSRRVRRLTPRECERLQGFPDDYTRIPWRGKAAEDCPDGPRYKAMGNSMAVPVMRWIGEGIAAVEGWRKS